MPSNSKSTRQIINCKYEDSEKIFESNLTHTSNDEYKYLLCCQHKIIPILFIPGIMGSRLKIKGKNHLMAWEPPNGTWEGLKALWEYIRKNAKERAEIWHPDRVEVVRDGSQQYEKDRNSHDNSSRERRGWSSVWRSGYYPIMEHLERVLNDISNQKEMLNAPLDYGMFLNSVPLTEQDCEKLQKFKYEVWGGGYNWLQSNDQSADELWTYIQGVIASYPTHLLNKEKKIVLVTHSMGGLVARALCAKGQQAEQILGVVHTVMPAAGAPAAYKRMRAGFEGLEKILLGRDGDEVSSVMVAAQGGLELLPFACYNDEYPWLFFPNEIDARKPDTIALPADCDPYEEIYKNQSWWGLIPWYNKYLDDRGYFNFLIDEVKKFHASITDYYHPLTYAVWGEFPGMKAWKIIKWKHREAWGVDRRNDDPFYSTSDGIIKDNRKGHVELNDYAADIEGPDCPGDSTVPSTSARHVIKFARNCKKCGLLVHNDETPKRSNDYEHSSCFGDTSKKGLMNWSVTYSVARIVLQTLGEGT